MSDKDFLSAVIDMGRFCNLSCLHCYNYSSPNKGKIINLRLIRQRIKEIAELNIKDLWVTGGEPTLYPELFDIINCAVESRLRVHVSTNGCFNETIANRLAMFPVKIVRVSLDGNEQMHEVLRGRGSFKKAMKGIKCLQKSNVPFGISLHLHKMVEQFQLDMLEPFFKWQCPINIGPILPIGRAKKFRKVCFSNIEFRQIALEIKKLDNKLITISDFLCYASKGVISIDAKGRHTLCCLRPKAVISRGNMGLERSVSQQRFQSSIRDRLECNCMECKL
jgi:MoaA/NifB/PqqE/SkfB family radical SAM enzyme